MRAHWEKKYKEGFYPSYLETHWLISRFWNYIKFGPVLEIAVGVGRDAIFLAKKGFHIFGFDISFEAIRKANENKKRENLKNLFLVQADADHIPFKDQSFGCVVVFYFFLRSVVEEIKRLLKRDGIVIYETFLKRQNMLDKKRNPEFLLEDGELYLLFENFECIFYEEGIFRPYGRPRAIARFVGRKR